MVVHLIDGTYELFRYFPSPAVAFDGPLLKGDADLLNDSCDHFLKLYWRRIPIPSKQQHRLGWRPGRQANLNSETSLSPDIKCMSFAVARDEERREQTGKAIRKYPVQLLAEGLVGYVKQLHCGEETYVALVHR